MVTKKNRFNKDWMQITGVIGVIFMIFGGGYTAGLYQGNIECTLDKNQMVIEYQSKLSEEINKNKTVETNANINSSRQLEELVKIIKNTKNGK